MSNSNWIWRKTWAWPVYMTASPWAIDWPQLGLQYLTLTWEPWLRTCLFHLTMLHSLLLLFSFPVFPVWFPDFSNHPFLGVESALCYLNSLFTVSHIGTCKSTMLPQKSQNMYNFFCQNRHISDSRELRHFLATTCTCQRRGKKGSKLNMVF